MARHIKSGDMVIITAGRDAWTKNRDASGKVISRTRNNTPHKVLRVLTGEDRVIVDGVNVRRKHVKPTQSNPQGGVVSVAMPIHISNVSPVDRNKKPTRVRFVTKPNGEKTRVAATTGEELAVLKKAKTAGKK